MIEINETNINPLPNDTKAASSGSPIWADSSPLILDWPAINAPESAESNSRRRFFLVELIYPNPLILHSVNKNKVSQCKSI
jgi:hypothetical protein